MDIKEIKELKDGKVIALDAENNEVEIDVKDTLSKLSTVNAESASRRIRLKELETELESLKQKEEELKGKKVIDPTEEEAKEQEINKNWKEKVTGLETKLTDKDQLIRNLTIGSKFATSDYINKNTILTSDIAESYFGKNFTVDDKGNVIAKRPDGTPIMSKANPENYAGFDEAVSELVDAMPNKDKILAAPKSGDGLKGSSVNGDYSFSHIKSFKDFKSTTEKTEYIKKYGLDAFKKLKR